MPHLADANRSSLRFVVAGRRRLRDWRGMAGEVPSSRGVDHGWLCRPGHIAHVRLVLRARSGADSVSVEVVTTVLLLLGLRWMPKRLPLELQNRNTVRARARRVRDATLAIVSGVGMSLLAYVVLTQPAGSGIKDFIVKNALPGGGGHNIVNVILVDFRGFDTFGEITVLGIVALTIYKLLRRFRPAPEVETTSAEKRDPGASCRIRAMTCRAVRCSCRQSSVDCCCR